MKSKISKVESFCRTLYMIEKYTSMFCWERKENRSSYDQWMRLNVNQWMHLDHLDGATSNFKMFCRYCIVCIISLAKNTIGQILKYCNYSWAKFDKILKKHKNRSDKKRPKRLTWNAPVRIESDDTVIRIRLYQNAAAKQFQHEIKKKLCANRNTATK